MTEKKLKRALIRGWDRVWLGDAMRSVVRAHNGKYLNDGYIQTALHYAKGLGIGKRIAERIEELTRPEPRDVLRGVRLYWAKPADKELPSHFWAVYTAQDVDTETIYQEGAMRLAIVSPHRPGKYEWCWERLGKLLIREMTLDEKQEALADGRIDLDDVARARDYRTPMQWPESTLYH